MLNQLWISGRNPTCSKCLYFYKVLDLVGNSNMEVLNQSQVAGEKKCSASSSVISDCVTPWAAAHQAPLSMGFPRQEHWSGLPFPFPGDLPGWQVANPKVKTITEGLREASGGQCARLFLTAPGTRPTPLAALPPLWTPSPSCRSPAAVCSPCGAE